MADIENKIVKLQFDNGGVVKTAKETAEAMDELNESLELKDASDGINNTQAALDQLSTEEPQKQVQSLQERFNILETAVRTIVTKITGNLMDSFTSAVSSVTSQLSGIAGMEAATEGWSKYESTVSSTQTIMNATGKSIEEVEEALAELQWYSDETSYSYSDMTDNVGKFTSAGIELDDAVQAMEGISNWAALAGANSSEAARAYYQLSQALGTGYIQQIDWKSIETLNMSTEEFKQSVIDTALEMGTLKETADGLYYAVGNEDDTFTTAGMRDYLKDQWLTTDVLMATLEDYSDYTREVYQLTEEEGLTASEAMEQLGGDVEDIGVKALKAAQEAKTFTDVIDALKDAASSGWSETFTLIVGNYEEAKELWTDVVNALWDLVLGGHDEMNDMLKEWNKLGGREDLLDGLYNICGSLLDIIWAIKDAWREVFPRTTADELYAITKAFKKLSESLVVGEKTADKIQRTFAGLFAVFDILWQIVSGVAGLIGSVFKGLFSGMDFGGSTGSILDLTAAIGDYLVSIDEALAKADVFEILGNSIEKGVSKATAAFKNFGANELTDGIDILTETLTKLTNKIKEINSSSIKTGLMSIVNTLQGWGDALLGVLNTVWNAINTVIDWIETNIIPPLEKLGNKLYKVIKPIISWIKDFATGMMDSISSGDFDTVSNRAVTILEALGAILVIGKLASTVYNLFRSSKLAKGIVKGVKELVGSMKDVATAVETNVKLQSFLTLAEALTLLALSVVILSALDTAKAWIAVGQLVTIMAALAGMVIIANKFAEGAAILSTVGLSILALVAVVLIMAEIPVDVVDAGLTNVGEVLLLFVAITILLSMITKLFGGLKIEGGFSKELTSLGLMFIAISAAMLLMIPFILVTAALPAEKLWQAMSAMGLVMIFVAGLALVVGGLVLAALAITKTTKKEGEITSSNSSFMKIGIILAVLMLVLESIMVTMLGAVVIFSLLPAEKLKNGADAFTQVMTKFLEIFAVLIVLVVACNKVSNGKLGIIIGLMAMLDILVLSIAGVLAILSTKIKSQEKVIMAAEALIAIVVTIALLFATLLIFKAIPLKTAETAIILIAGLDSLIGVMGALIATFASLPTSGMNHAMIAMGEIGGLILAFVICMAVISKNKSGFSTLLLEYIAAEMVVFASVISVIGSVMVALGSLSAGQLGVAAASMALIAVLIAVFIGALIVLNKSELPTNIGTTATVLLGMIYMARSLVKLAEALVIISSIGDMGQALKACGILALAMVELLGTVAIMILLAKMASALGVSNKDVLVITSAVSQMALLMVAVAGVLVVIRHVKVNSSMLATLGVMALVMVALEALVAGIILVSKLVTDTSSVLIALGAMELIAITTIGIMYALTMLTDYDMDELWSATKIMLVIMVAIVAALAILMVVAKFTGTGACTAVAEVLVSFAIALAGIAAVVYTAAEAVDVFVGAIETLSTIDNFDEVIITALGALGEGLVVMIEKIIEEIPDLLDSLLTALQEIAEGNYMISFGDVLADLLLQAFEGMLNSADKIVAFVSDAIILIIDHFCDAVVERMDEINESIYKVTETVTELAWGAIGGVTRGLIRGTVEGYQKAVDSTTDELWDLLQGDNEEKEAAIEEAYEEQVAWLSDYEYIMSSDAGEEALKGNAQILAHLFDEESEYNVVDDYRAWCEKTGQAFTEAGAAGAYNMYQGLIQSGALVGTGFDEFLGVVDNYEEMTEYVNEKTTEFARTCTDSMALLYKAEMTYDVNNLDMSEEERIRYYRNKYRELAAKEGKTLKEYVEAHGDTVKYSYEELTSIGDEAAEESADTMTEANEEAEDEVGSSMDNLLSSVIDTVNLGGDASDVTSTLSSVTDSLTSSFSGLNSIDLSNLTDQFSSFDSLSDVDISGLTTDMTSLSEIDMSTSTDSLAELDDMDLSSLSMDIGDLGDSTDTLSTSLTSLTDTDLTQTSLDLSSISDSTSSLTESIGTANEDGSLEITPSINDTQYNKDYETFMSTLSQLVSTIDTMEENGDFTITPVIDMSQVETTLASFESSGVSQLFKTPTSTVSIDISLTTIENKLQSITEELSDLRGDVQSISNMQIVLDSGTVAGSMTNKINSNLGKKAVFASRGVLY